MKAKSREGFTLIELLITIAIIGILAAIAVPIYTGQQKKAAASEAHSNLTNLRLLEEQYYAENGRYSPDPTPMAAVAYTRASTTMQAALPNFRPGDPDNLKFDYSLISCDEDQRGICDSATGAATCNGGAGASAGQIFVACAFGRDGTISRDEVYWINQDNESNF